MILPIADRMQARIGWVSPRPNSCMWFVDRMLGTMVNGVDFSSPKVCLVSGQCEETPQHAFQ